LQLGLLVSAVNSEGRTIWIADAQRDGKRFIVRADEKLTAFLELESQTRACKRTKMKKLKANALH